MHFFAIVLAAASSVWQPQTIALLDYHTTIPDGWTPRRASSRMRLAEFVVPSPSDKGAEVIISPRRLPPLRAWAQVA